jgi:hypothetical protein
MQLRTNTIFFLVALLVSAFTAAPAVAQTQITTGVIQGVVVDETDAVMPGATVTVRNIETNFEQTADSDENGRFVFLQLRPGPYTLRVSREGFTTLVQENLSLGVGQTIPLTMTMRVSPVAEEVVVTATPTVDVVKTESSSSISDLTVDNLPVIGRKFEDLFSLTPGVAIVSSPDGDQITFAGQRGTANNISLDGGDYNNGFFGEQSGGQRPVTDITMAAIKEFQVVATGGTAEFGRTAGGVVNVITKSGTNDVHGEVFYFQRHENLTANDSRGRPLRDFDRKQFGGAIGGPIVKDKAFFFGAFEQIYEDLTRPNLSEQLGDTACPQTSFDIVADEALLLDDFSVGFPPVPVNADCQRLALLEFFQNDRSQEEGNPVMRDIENTSFLLKGDFNITPANQLSTSYTFNRSENVNQTFDVPTYGNSANGIEGTPSIIQALNVNLFSSISPTMFNEAHFTYGREKRPRAAVDSNVPADTGMGFGIGASFRFGAPFFLQPNIDELFWRSQVRDNFSIIAGNHTIKFGGEWIHSVNNQVFRGFSTGRYIFDTTLGFLRYASAPLLDPLDPAYVEGFGPTTAGCVDGSFADFRNNIVITNPGPDTILGTADDFDETFCDNLGDGIADALVTGGPLLLYLQEASPGLSPLALGESSIDNEDFGFFIQDKWQIRPNFTLNFGLRWDIQYMADPVDDPSITSYGSLLNDPLFPSDGTIPDQTDMWQPRVGFAWDPLNNGKSVLRGSWGFYYARHNMLSQVGSITANGVQQQTDVAFSDGFFTTDEMPTWPEVRPIPTATVASAFAGVRVTASNFENPKTQTVNANWEQEFAPDWAYYVDFTWAKGVHLTRFLDFIRIPGNTWTLGNVMTASSPGKSLYRGLTIGMRKKYSKGFQLEWNYRYAKDKDDDSNERDPFTDRALDITDLSLDYSLSDRDIKHTFNFFSFAELPGKFELNTRIQARTAQPITDPARAALYDPAVGVDTIGRNTLRKDTKFFSLDWRLSRPFRFGDERYAIVPVFEMFNTFDNTNNLDPLTTELLFNFDGFLRQGVGDPLQVQLAVKFIF